MQGNKLNAPAFDFGILYKTGFKSLTFGMAVRNFSSDQRYVNENFQMPLTFKMGVAMNILDLTDMDKKVHSFLISMEAEHPRDFSEQLKIGGEYLFMDLLALRIGYLAPADEHGISYGVGLQKDFEGVGLGVDYAYTPFGIFGKVQRFDVRFSF